MTGYGFFCSVHTTSDFCIATYGLYGGNAPAKTHQKTNMITKTTTNRYVAHTTPGPVHPSYAYRSR